MKVGEVDNVSRRVQERRKCTGRKQQRGKRTSMLRYAHI
jgi:hypothetical protein